jgi:hypothetical protein
MTASSGAMARRAHAAGMPAVASVGAVGLLGTLAMHALVAWLYLWYATAGSLSLPGEPLLPGARGRVPNRPAPHQGPAAAGAAGDAGPV